MTTFNDFNFVPQIQQALQKAGFKEPTEIQKATISHIMNGKDIAGLAQTGTGKTAAFLLPLMERIYNANRDLSTIESEEEKKALSLRSFHEWKSRHFVLVLVPTRELAEQIVSEARKFSDGTLRSTAIYGGTSYDGQKKALKEGVDFVVATPGRLIDLYKEHFVDLKQVRAVVFDEADRMFDMGFKDDMVYLLSRIPKDRQFLVYSATLNFDVLNVAYRFGAAPIECNVSLDQTKAENVKDAIFHVGDKEKPTYLLSIFKKYNPKQVIIFTNYKSNVERIERFLNQNAYEAVGISSMLSQPQRNRILEKFKSNRNSWNILVATDVAARGLDVKGVDMVINYELPEDAENYVHRIGRTGRAGSEGLAFSFSGHQDVEALGRIENYLDHKVEVAWLDDGDMLSDKGVLPGSSQKKIYVKEGVKKKSVARRSRDPRFNNDSTGRRSTARRNKVEGEEDLGASNIFSKSKSSKNSSRKKSNSRYDNDQASSKKTSSSRASSSRRRRRGASPNASASASTGTSKSNTPNTAKRSAKVRDNTPSWKAQKTKPKSAMGFIKRLFGK